MSYYKAKEAFKEALNYVSPKKDPAIYDLCVGLYQLTQQIENDISDLQGELRQVHQDIQHLQR